MTVDQFQHFYDTAVQELDREIARAEFWGDIPVIGKWLAAKVARRIERQTNNLIIRAIKDGKMRFLPLAKNHAELVVGETVTVDGNQQYEVLELVDGKVLLG